MHQTSVVNWHPIIGYQPVIYTASQLLTNQLLSALKQWSVLNHDCHHYNAFLKFNTDICRLLSRVKGRYMAGGVSQGCD